MGCKSTVVSRVSICFVPFCLFAQDPRGNGSGEFVAYVGPTFGEIGSHVSVGAGTYVDLGHGALLGIDTAYTSMGDRTLRPYPDSFTVRSSRLYDFNLTLQIRAPYRFKRFSPYGLLSVGLQHSSFENAAGTDQNLIYARNSTDNWGFATGGGGRYYIGESWGLRPEVRVCITARTYVRMSVGVFAEVPDWDLLLPLKLRSWLKPLKYPNALR